MRARADAQVMKIKVASEYSLRRSLWIANQPTVIDAENLWTNQCPPRWEQPYANACW